MRKYDMRLTVNEEGFWLASMAGGKHFGDVAASPGEAVESLLERLSVETKNGAIVRGVRKLSEGWGNE